MIPSTRCRATVFRARRGTVIFGLVNKAYMKFVIDTWFVAVRKIALLTHKILIRPLPGRDHLASVRAGWLRQLLRLDENTSLKATKT